MEVARLAATLVAAEEATEAAAAQRSLSSRGRRALSVVVRRVSLCTAFAARLVA